MIRKQDSGDAAATPALLLWSRLVQGATAVVIVLSLILLLSPRLGEAIFNLVYFHQLSIPVEVPSLAHRYIWFANGIIGAVMSGWMICIILLARGPFLEGKLHAWNTIATNNVQPKNGINSAAAGTCALALSFLQCRHQRGV